jgi:tetratricopeptide (TPR) repeat protein
MTKTRARAASLRSSSRAQTVLALALAWSLAACGPSDPLEEVRQLQDQSSDYAGSIEPLRELIDARPDDPEVQYRYGLALLVTGQRALAVWPLQKALESPEWEERASLPLAQAFVATGSYDDAIEMCGRVLERKPDDISALLLRAYTRIQSRRDYEGALQDADRVLELDPDNAEALVPRTVALLALERVEEAATSLDALEALYRDESLGLHGSAGLCTAQASFAKEKGELERAEELYDRCLEKFPADGVLVSDALQFFDILGKPERSQQILERALAQMPEAHSYRGALVLRLRSQGKKAEAEQVQRAGTTHEAPMVAAEAWAGLAALAVEDGKYDEAVAAFEKARELDTSASPQLLFAHADALVIAGRTDEALALAASMSVPAHRELVRGRVALARDEPAAALERFAAGILFWPNNAIARYYAAIAAERVGDFPRAIEEYRYAMRIDSTATDAYLRLARLHAAAGRDEEALAVLTFQPGGRPDELDAALLEMQILAKLGKLKDAPAGVKRRLAAREHRGAAVAAVAEGVRQSRGAAAAAEAVRKTDGVDLGDPVFAEALSALIENLALAGKSAEGLSRADAAARAHPDSAVLQALRGRALVLHGGSDDSARAAFERALELDPNEARASAGLARLEQALGKRESALALYDRAAAADPDDDRPAREAAALLVALDRREDAEKRLRVLLDEHPYDAEAAVALAELRLARGADATGTRELAQRAVEFGGGPAAQALLERVTPASGPSAAKSPDAG